MNIVLDIETIPSQLPGVREMLAEGITCPGSITKADSIAAWEIEKKPLAIEEAWRKTSFDGALGHIAVISMAVDDSEPQTFYNNNLPGGEGALLIGFFTALMDATTRATEGGTQTKIKPMFIGHNLANFDLPFIFQRAVVLGIQPPSCIPFGAKPWDDRIFDTMARWNTDPQKRVSLDRLCRVFGIEYKSECDGSQVWDWIKAGRIAEVADYCAEDVINTRLVYKRMTFQQVV